MHSIKYKTIHNYRHDQPEADILKRKEKNKKSKLGAHAQLWHAHTHTHTHACTQTHTRALYPHTLLSLISPYTHESNSCTDWQQVQCWPQSPISHSYVLAIFNLTAMWYCVGWWNAQRFQSKSTVQMTECNLPHMLWFQLFSFVISLSLCCYVLVCEANLAAALWILAWNIICDLLTG